MRARGCSEDDAAEWTQEFFRRLLERGGEAGLPERLGGAFRAYLKRSLVNFLKDQWRAESRLKRGGGAAHLELDDELAVGEGVSPDAAFARGWAMAVIDRAARLLEEEMEAAGKGDFFRAVAGTLDGSERGVDRGELAGSFGMTDGAFRVALHRLRGRFRHLIEEELRETVSTQEELDEEIRYLLSVWS